MKTTQHTGPTAIRRILVPTDFSECAEQAFTYALDLAARQGARVHLLHVMNFLEGDHYSPLRFSPEAAVRRETPDKLILDHLRATIEAHRAEGVRVDPVKVRGRSVVQAVLDHAAREQIDLIVLGTRGRGSVQHFMLGSITEEIVRRATCDVLTVRVGAEAAPSAVERILVPLDLAPSSARVLARAKEVAAGYGAAMDVLHVIEPLPFPAVLTGIMTVYDVVPDVRDQSEEHLRRLVREAPGPEVPADLHLEDGHPARLIVEQAAEYGTDLIIMGTHGLSGFEHFFLGSVTERVVRTAASPVLVVRIPEESVRAEVAEAVGQDRGGA